MGLEIICTECGVETLVRKEPVYDGFKKVGEKVFCASCGHEFSNENEIPYQEQKKKPAIFNDSDKSKKLDIFKDEERTQNCRHCEYYIVNPFVQRCSLHEKEVDSTDVCFDFKLKEQKAAEPENEGDATSE
jgi:hypothetical protein